MTTFTAILHKEESLYVAECPEVGTASQGETIEEDLDNLREATELYLEEFPLRQSSRPLMAGLLSVKLEMGVVGGISTLSLQVCAKSLMNLLAQKSVPG